MFPIIYSDVFLEHETGYFHPENPGRLLAIVEALGGSPLASQLQWCDPRGDRPDLAQWLGRVHHTSYLQTLTAICRAGGGMLDGDTPVSRRSDRVSQLAVAAWLDGVDRVWETGSPAFVAARPPGHHARPNQGMGFCIFANAAIAAYYGREQLRIPRIAILDWDVHHGNGTQEAIWHSEGIAMVSLHQSPFYPGTGAAEEVGEFHQILNIPLPAGAAITEYEAVFKQRVLPFLQSFAPDLLIVSAGFDANRDDPLASMNLLPQDFGRLTEYCWQITPKILFGLEGGYDYDSLGASVVSVIATCLAAMRDTI
ncbi:MAG: histone deacetylase [Oscillatoriales cyanobacterium SM2_2_1]|nr:histone deacetylase [Oscillatoriales cyanobacterium SM2_2_1]